MGRRTPAESARIAVQRLLDQRKHYADKLAAIDAELYEIGAQLPGVTFAEPDPPAPGPARPAMAGAPAAVDPKAPKKTLEQLMAEAKLNPAPEGLPPDQRPPFVELTQDMVLGGEGAEHLSPADSQGAGRWM